jgi:nucleotide-binding universal stress UspA family protein
VGDLLERVVVPVASESDAEQTMDAVLERVSEAGGAIVAVHVIEKAGGAPDKASVEQREQYATDIFAVVRDACEAAGVHCETDQRFDTDVVDSIFDAARDHDASAVVFTPRESNRWLDLLTGDRSRGIVKRAELPVVVFPRDGTDATEGAE